MANEHGLNSATGRHRSRAGTGLYGSLVDLIGQEIIDGDLPVGTIVQADQLGERFGVSRSVVREAVRTLSSMGLVEARPQVGTRVLSKARWDLLNPHVVRWRARGGDYLLQMKELLELRLGVEQAAAGFAAKRMSAHEAEQLLASARQMRVAFVDGEPHRFFTLDIEFHRRLLNGSGNVVLAQLAETIAATLDARRRDKRPGMDVMTSESIDHHVRLAQAIVRGSSDTAERLARRLVSHTLAEFDRLWADSASAALDPPDPVNRA
jgi:DNA-binding FadR family transcriptional regulator